MTGADRARFVHLIPHFGIGGVEIAARTMTSVDEPDLSFRVDPIMPSSALGWASQLGHMLRAVRRLSANPPDVLIVSLWRACLVGAAVKLLRPGTRLVLFLHSTVDVHVADRLATRLAFVLSETVWGDSGSTLAKRLGGRAKKGRLISFRIAALEPVERQAPRPAFVFWGRIHPVKRLDAALRIFAGVRQGAGEGHFVIAGPDDGARATLERLAADLGLADCVSFAGAVTAEQLPDLAARASFFLMTSEAEGMAVAAVEAMQLGLVPVVTPVGELAAYARDGENAVIVSRETTAISDVLRLLAEPERYARLSAAAVATWRGTAVYRDSVLAACRALL